jgi:hypothetical protein
MIITKSISEILTWTIQPQNEKLQHIFKKECWSVLRSRLVSDFLDSLNYLDHECWISEKDEIKRKPPN